MKKVLSFLCLLIVGVSFYAFAQSDGIPKKEPGKIYKTKSVKKASHSKTSNVLSKVPALSEVKRAKRMANSYSEYLDVSSISGVESGASIDGWNFPLGETNLWFGQGEGSIPPRYYTTGNTLRMYYGNHLVIYGSSSNVQITSVSFTFYNGKKWTVEPSLNNGSYSTSSNTWSGYTNSLEMISDETVYIQRIDVTYSYGESQSTEVVPPLFNYNSSEWNYIGKGEFKDAWFNIFWNSGIAEPYEVDIYQNKSNSNLYLAYNPYGGSDSPYAEINQSSQTGYLIFDVTDPECVIVRPSVYAATFDIGDSNAPFYNFNLEAYYYYNGNSYSSIKNYFKEQGISISTYKSSTREISIKNGLFYFEPGVEDGYTWTGDTMEGYLKLPQTGGGDAGNTGNLSLFEYKPSEWSYLGEGEFKDAWLPVFWTTGSAQPYDVPVYRNNTNRNQYLIMNPYGAATPYSDINLSSQNGYIFIDASNPNCVLVRPLVYAAFLDSDLGNGFYPCNAEGINYYGYGVSIEDIIESLRNNGYTPSTYDSSRGIISFQNASFTFNPDLEALVWTEGDMTGYLVLPGFSGDNNDTSSSSITVCYLADGTEQTRKINRGSNGMYETEISNLEWFYFIDDNTGSGFAMNLYESNLGTDLPTVNYLDTGKPYTYTPWNGTYTLTVSGDHSIARAETKTSKPSSIALCLPGSYKTTGHSPTLINSNRQEKINSVSQCRPTSPENGK